MSEVGLLEPEIEPYNVFVVDGGKLFLEIRFQLSFADIQPTTNHNFRRVWQLYHNESRILPYKVHTSKLIRLNHSNNKILLAQDRYFIVTNIKV